MTQEGGGLDPFEIKDATGTTGETGMECADRWQSCVHVSFLIGWFCWGYIGEDLYMEALMPATHS